VARLIAGGRMTPHGLKQVEAAKADGRWDAAYAGSAKTTLPEELVAAIRKHAKAQATFEGLNAANRYAMAFRIHHIKGEAARAKRIEAFVAMLAKGETLHPNGKGAAKKAPTEEGASKRPAGKGAGKKPQASAKKASATSAPATKSTRGKR
jgi:hypothetical protein